MITPTRQYLEGSAAVILSQPSPVGGTQGSRGLHGEEGGLGNTKDSSLETQVVSPFGPFHELML